MFCHVRKKLNNNLHLLLGVLVGLYISTLLSTPQCHKDTNVIVNKNVAGSEKRFVPPNTEVNRQNVNFTRKLATAKKTKPIRPR